MPVDHDSALKISTLGGLSIQLAGRRIEFATRKAEALLVYLASLRRDHPREILATMLWAEQSQTQALTSLRTALANLRKHLRPYIHATRSTIGLQETNIWFDIAALEQHLKNAEIEAAMALYQGEFLEGFYVSSAATFENWQVAERERIHQLVRQGLHGHISRSISTAQFAAGLASARQLLDLDPLDELAQQQMMTLLAYNGQRTAALSFYAECRQLLWEELGIEPEEASRHLYTQIKSGALDVPARVVWQPGFLEDQRERGSPTVVVAREAELARLEIHLGRVLQHQGVVAFITGNAGRGKTTLITEFIRHALQDYPDLLVVNGHCHDYAGLGDPYSPFRDVMAMITGDVESRWASGAVSREHALRLWRQTPSAIAALLDYGPNLVDLLVPAVDLITHATAARQETGAADHLVQRLGQLNTGQPYLEQSYIFEQLTNVLRAIAKDRPLLITLDDFQWADLASISLLFHLGRRIKDMRIMILCAYRPDELPQMAGATPHPLKPTLNELKRLFGDTWIELDQTKEETGRVFVDALLNTEPNELDEAFRHTLHAHTGGQPLFTVELLRAMQERGDLAKENGKWRVSKELDWQLLPARVEAVIAERINRLDAPLQEILAIASVEGESFTAQVVSTVQGTELRTLIRRVSRELIKRHQLVRSNNIIHLEDRRLFRYQFHHILFQKHLYDQLDPIERELLHQEVAVVLEDVYGNQSGDIAPQLAYHYHQAHDLPRARHYYFQAGKHAQAIYANEEAIGFFTQALALTPATDTHFRLDLLLAREKIYSLLGNREAQESDLRAMETLARSLDDTARQADVALCWASYREITGDYSGSVTAASQSLACARQINDQEREAKGLLALGLALLRQGEYEPALRQLTIGLETAQRLVLDPLAGEILTRMGLLHQMQGDNHAAQPYHEEALAIYRQLGNRLQEGWVLNSLGNIVFDSWQYKEALATYTQALSIFREVGNLQGQGNVLNNLGLVSAAVGSFQKAKQYYEGALAIFQTIDHPLGTGAIFNNLGETAWFLEDYATGRTYYSQALQIFQKIGNRPYQSYGLTGLGNVSLKLGDLEAAEGYYQQAIALDEELGNLIHAVEARAGLAQVYLAQAEDEPASLEEAYRLVTEIMNYLEQGNKLVTSLSTFWIYLTCYRIFQIKQDSRAPAALRYGRQHVQEWVDQIADSDLRNRLLTQFHWIREIMEMAGNL